MKARARTALGTGFLVLVLAAVGGVAYVGVHLRGEERARRDEGEKKLFAFAPGDVTALRVAAKGDTVALAREGDGRWRISEPVSAAADEGAVRRLLERLAALERRGESAASGASADVLRRFGLDAPKVRLEATLADGRAERLALGDSTGFDGAMFVTPTDGRVVVVAGEARDALELGLFDLRDKRVLPGVAQDAVAAIRFEGRRGAFEVRRAAAAKPAEPAWRLAPGDAPADGRKVGDLLRALATLDAAAIADEAGGRLAEHGLARPRHTVVLSDADGKELARLLVGDAAGGRVRVKSGASPVVWEVAAAALPGIPSAPQDLAEPPAEGPAAAKTGG